jgi:osmotically-inducible protein OsmY
MKADDDIKRDIEEALSSSPLLEPNDIIGVAVKNGVVSLTGFVRTYADKYEAEAAAKRVAGVLGVANDIQVRLPGEQRPDPEIARDAAAAVKSRLPAVAEQIRIIVNDGVIRLEGEVEWEVQRKEAERAVYHIGGIKGVTNLIKLKPQDTATTDIKRNIEEAFRHSAEIEASRITVEMKDGEAILRGSVRSWVERREAERAAWAAPGVTRVTNEIAIEV